MRKRIPKILVTGAAGFIGSAFVKKIICDRDINSKIVVLDKLTYAADLKRLDEVRGGFKFYRCDSCDQRRVRDIFKQEKPDKVVNFAAETHVDRSILGSDEFLRTNVLGTQVVLDASRECGVSKFVHISTDEVYGDIIRGKFSEKSLMNPSSPYSASKASADLLIKSFIRTYDMPAVIVRPSNNYGPWQYPEKLIPVIIYKALKGKKVPVYAKGLNVREWLHVQDCAAAIIKVLEKGKKGEVYNVGSGVEKKNIDVVRNILDILGLPHSLIDFVRDRPGHDFRYSLDSSKIRKETGWKPEVDFDRGLRDTVCWYKNHISWLEAKTSYLKDYWSRVYK